jgi:NAD(P)-dependent dehydrogenase (short-subunit alcohol dehydrogenase family)
MRLTESMAAELRAAGIRVNCVIPGTLDTPQNRELMAQSPKMRWVAPEQVAHLILFLASPQAAAVSGACIPAFGGV